MSVHMRVQVKVGVGAILVIIAFSISAVISAFVFHDHHHRKMFIGSVGLVTSVAMYSSPLVVVVSYILIHSVYINIHKLYIFNIFQILLNNLLWKFMQKQVIMTKSVEFMPFYLSLFSFLSSSVWMAYGLASHDLFLSVSTIFNMLNQN